MENVLIYHSSLNFTILKSDKAKSDDINTFIVNRAQRYILSFNAATNYINISVYKKSDTNV